MQPLIATRDYPQAPVARMAAPRRDPAPSRVAYRLHRLWLTPLFRLLLRKGLPIFAAVFGAGLYIQDPDRQAAITGWIDGVRQSIAERPEFAVRLMAIDGASAELSDAIRAVVPLDFPLSSFELDLSRIHADVTRLDAVAAADVRVRKGGILQIVVVERQPAVVWRSSEAIGTLDRSGHRVTALQARLERPDLPLLAGLGADRAVPEALALLAAAAPIADRIRGLVRVGERRWDLVVEPEIRLMLPEADPVPALEQIVALHQASQLLDRDITAVDLRNPSRATLRLTGPAAFSFREIKQMTGAQRP